MTQRCTHRCAGRCAPLLSLAIVFDLLGLTLLLLGIFGNLRYDGRFYGDFLIYTASIVIFFSLVWWLLWYTGNVEVTAASEEEPEGSALGNLAHWARKLSERLSRSALMTPENKEKQPGPGCAFHNGGYEAHAEEKGVELGVLRGNPVEKPT